MSTPTLTPAEISQIIAMAWDDETSFEAIQSETGLTEALVKAVMKRELKAGSYRAWRERVKGRQKKHGQRHLAMIQVTQPLNGSKPDDS